MKTTSIQVGKKYEVKAGRNTTTVKVKSVNRKTGGWVCKTKGGKTLNVTDAARFVREVGTKKSVTKTKSGKPKGTFSGLDAAHKVLVEARRPMNVREIFETAKRNKYCCLNGATPTLTIYAAILREVKLKGRASRFVKTDRGLFAAR